MSTQAFVRTKDKDLVWLKLDPILDFIESLHKYCNFLVVGERVENYMLPFFPRFHIHLLCYFILYDR